MLELKDETEDRTLLGEKFNFKEGIIVNRTHTSKERARSADGIPVI
jgi:hypothetical protein